MSTAITETPIQACETEKTKLLVLRTGDDQEFKVEQSLTIQSVTIKNLFEDDCASSVIPIPNVESETLTKVIEYLKGHADENTPKDDLKEFDKKFVQRVLNAEDIYFVFDLVEAANYLDIKGLLDLTCQYIAESIKDKSVEEVRKLFNINNDFTEEEEADIRREYSWAFE